MHNNQLDKFIEVLIEEMTTKQLWKVVFNKMTNAAKRQMIGEMLNTLMGSGYSSSTGNLFDYNSKEFKNNDTIIDRSSLKKEILGNIRSALLVTINRTHERSLDLHGALNELIKEIEEIKERV